MTKKSLLSTAVLLLLTTTSWADDNRQTVTINGQTVVQKATKLTFDGDNVVVHFADGTQQSADMEQVTLAFDWVTVGIEKTEVASSLDDRATYDLQGRRVEGQAKAGIYLIRQNGKTFKVIKK